MRLTSVVEGISTLRANPLRTLLSTLGIIMGVASLVAVLAVGDGVEAFAREQVAGTTDLQIVAVEPLAYRTVDGVRLPNQGYPVFTLDDAEAVAALVPAGTSINLQTRGSATLASPRFDRPRAAVVVAELTGPDSVVAGRRLVPADARDGAAVAVISAGLAAALSPDPPSLIGDSVALEGTWFRIVGVAAGFRGEDGFAVTVPFPFHEQALTRVADPRVTPIIATAGRLEDVSSTKAALERWAAGRVPNGKDLVAVRNRQNRLAQAEQGVLIFKLLMGTITGISLLVGGIGIMNVLLAAVAERTREIGIRKATGARRSDILLQFLAESASITLVGAVIGIGLGQGTAFLATAVMRDRANVQLYAAFTAGTVFFSALVAVVVGLVFGMYPALRAARLDPIEAIRHE